MCGRLKCCLRYEYQTYVELKKTLPAVGAPVGSVKGDGTVVRQNVLRQTVVVRRSEDNVEGEATRDDPVVPPAHARRRRRPAPPHAERTPLPCPPPLLR